MTIPNVVASQVAYNTTASSVMDGTSSTSSKWFSLLDNKLDGSYKLVGPGTSQGWWGTSISNASGILSPAPVLTITETRTMWGVQVYGDPQVNEYPVDFKVELYDGSTLVHTHNVVGNTLVTYEGSFPQPINVTSAVYTFTKVNKANRSIRLLEIAPTTAVVKNSSDNIKVKFSEASVETVSFSRSDILLPMITETSAETVNLFRTDSLTPKVTETSTESVSFTRTDSLTPKITETSVETVSLYTVDTLAPKINEQSSQTAQLLSSDSMSLSLSEKSLFTLFELWRADIVKPKITETRTVTAILTALDSLLPKIVDDVVDVKTSITSTDSLNPKLSEQVNITAQLVAGDAILPKLAEQVQVTNTFSTADLLKLNATETRAVTGSFASQDSLQTKLGEITNLTAAVISSDTVKVTISDAGSITAHITAGEVFLPKLVEQTSPVINTFGVSDNFPIDLADRANAVAVSLSASDTLYPKISDNGAVTVSFSSADNLLAKLSEQDVVTALLYGTDNLPLKTVEVTAIATQIYGADTLTPKLGESKAITVSFVSADILKPKTVETRAVTNNLRAADIISIRPSVEEADWFVEVNRGDSIYVTLGEQSFMTNVYTVMDAPTRQVFGRVEITYTDPFRDETLVLSASETGRHTYVEQLSDSITEPAYKWFSLHDNKLDGTYHPMPELGEFLSVGWWSTSMSNSSGVFTTTQPRVTIEFSARALTELRVVGDLLLNSYPVDFTFRAYNAEGTLLHTRAVTGNTQVNWHEIVDPPVLLITKLELTIHKINKPNQVAKVTELFTAIKEVYEGDIIQSINLLEEIGYNTGSLPIGNISSNEIDIVLSNADRHFDLNNKNSPLYGYIKRNRRIRAWLGAEVIPGDIEWHPLGTFWSTTWDITKGSLVTSLTGRDRLELLRLTDFDRSKMYQNKTLFQLFKMVLDDAGLAPWEYDLDPALAEVTIPYAWFDKVSHREALVRLSKCAVIQVYCTKDNVIRVNIHLDATPTPMMTFDDDTNVYHARYPLAVAEQVNYVEVLATQWVTGTREELFDGSEIIEMKPGETVIRTYEFNSKPAIACEQPIIQATNGIVVKGYELFAWGIEITYHHPGTTAGTITSVTVNGQLLKESGKQVATAKDDHLIREDGKIKESVQDDLIQGLAYAQNLADTLLNTYKTARHDVVLENRGNIALRLGDRVTVTDEGEYMISRQNVSWNGFLEATTEGKKL